MYKMLTITIAPSNPLASRGIVIDEAIERPKIEALKQYLAQIKFCD